MKKLIEEELVKKLNELNKQKTEAIRNGEYENAALIRDEIRKYSELLEDIMNPICDSFELSETKEEIIEKIEELEEQKKKAIAKREYARVAILRDKQKKYRILLQDILFKNNSEPSSDSE